MQEVLQVARTTSSDGNLVSALDDNFCPPTATPGAAHCPYIYGQGDLNTIINSNRVFINELAAIPDVNCNGRNDYDLFNIVSINPIIFTTSESGGHLSLNNEEQDISAHYVNKYYWNGVI